MSKRFMLRSISSQNVKRPKLDITVSQQSREQNLGYRTNAAIGSTSSSSVGPSTVGVDTDEWDEEDEFPEGEDILKNIETFALSQASQDVNTSVMVVDSSPKKSEPLKTYSSVSRINRDSQPSTSRYQPNFRLQPSQILSSSKNFRGPSQTMGSSTNSKIIAATPTANDFRDNLLMNNQLNSTFQSRNVVADPDEMIIRKLEKLESENKKLLDDLRIKEGESIYLRNQLNAAQTKNTKLLIEKECAIDKQSTEYQTQVSELMKKNQALITQLEFKDHEIKTAADKLKKVAPVLSPQTSFVKTPTKKKTNQASQASFPKGNIYKLKSQVILYPFEDIPPTIFQPSLPEKPIVDIHIIDRSGKLNLPILEDYRTPRIFEDPKIVTPMVTKIDNKILNVEFLNVDVAKIMKITDGEINSLDAISIINKIVATTRELLLNILTVLQSIKGAMNNDDERDMDDVYLSNFYDTDVTSHQTLCDATEWHEKERGIEARRCLGLLVIISKNSNYLSRYIAGTSQLSTRNEDYVKQMTRYKQWSQQAHEYEMLEIFNELAVAINFVKRPHQFTGLICGIAQLIANVQSTVEFTDERALNLVANIFKELVFSRPLLKSLITLTEMMKSFNSNEFFINRLINNKSCQSNERIYFDEVTSFSYDDCVLEVYLRQIRTFTLINVNKVNLMYELIEFVDVALKLGHIELPKSPTSKRCCSALYEFIIHYLHRCVTIDTDELKKEFVSKEMSNYNSLSCWKGKIDGYYWIKFRTKFFNLLKIGIRFLTFFSFWDVGFFVTSSEELDLCIFLFLQDITNVNGLNLSETDLEALEHIKSKFLFEQEETTDLKFETPEIEELFSIKNILMDEPETSRKDNQDMIFNNKQEYQKTLAKFKAALQI